jgi:hypothetical protein
MAGVNGACGDARKASHCSIKIAGRTHCPAELRQNGRVRTNTSTLATHPHNPMHEIIYLIGLVVVVMFILGLIGVR